MYPIELEIKDTWESNTSASYLDLLLSIGRNSQLHISLYDKRDDFEFHITNKLSFLRSNIPLRLSLPFSISGVHKQWPGGSEHRGLNPGVGNRTFITWAR